METPDYIKRLCIPTAKKTSSDRKVWSIELERVWLPFFTATNAQGDTAVPSADLGAPLRLSYDKAGAVRFSQSGRPIIRVAKELGDNIRVQRENYIAGLLNFVADVEKNNADGYKAQVEMARKAGEPILSHDRAEQTKALNARADAEAKVKADAVAAAEAAIKADADTATKPKPKTKELVHA